MVILHDQVAIKMPLRYRSSSGDDVDTNIEAIQREQNIYRRLGQCDGVVPCIGFSERTIQLAVMKNGDLRSYLKQNRPPKSLRLTWLRQMADTLSRIHDHAVIVADIASRNFLLDSDLSVKFCDFTESSIMPLNINMETVDDNGYSIQTDIGQLGAVIYEVVTGKRCDFDLFKDLPPDATKASWPRRESLPSTHKLWLGPIIEQCWTKGSFQDANRLAETLNSVSLDKELSQQNETGKDLQKKFLYPLRMSKFPTESLITCMVTIGVFSFLTAWVWKRY